MKSTLFSAVTLSLGLWLTVPSSSLAPEVPPSIVIMPPLLGDLFACGSIIALSVATGGDNIWDFVTVNDSTYFSFVDSADPYYWSGSVNSLVKGVNSLTAHSNELNLDSSAVDCTSAGGEPIINVYFVQAYHNEYHDEVNPPVYVWGIKVTGTISCVPDDYYFYETVEDTGNGCSMPDPTINANPQPCQTGNGWNLVTFDDFIVATVANGNGLYFAGNCTSTAHQEYHLGQDDVYPYVFNRTLTWQNTLGSSPHGTFTTSSSGDGGNISDPASY